MDQKNYKDYVGFLLDMFMEVDKNVNSDLSSTNR